MMSVNRHHESCRSIQQRRALWWYLASLLVLSLGSIVAAWHYPGGFDWRYRVASALASKEDNPAGSIWFAGALSLTMVLLWSYVSELKKGPGLSPSPATGFSISALRTGLVCGALLGLEGLFIRDLSNWVTKGHEILGILAFLGLYIGVLGLLGQAAFRRKFYAIPAFLVATPLVAIGITQFRLYLEQRNTGWVGTNWKEIGIPLWSSFAFWQWLAIGFLMLGLGLLSFIRSEENTIRTTDSPS